MKKTGISPSLADDRISKTKITSKGLNSSEFNFSDQMLYKPTSTLNKLLHWRNNISANIYNWYVSHPSTIYSLKRVAYGIVTLLLALCVLALLISMQIDWRDLFMDPNYAKLHWTKEQAEAVARLTMERYGYSENPIIFLGNFLYNLMPFIPKWVLANIQLKVDPATGDLIKESDIYYLVFVNLGQTFRNNVAIQYTPVTEIFANAIPYTFAFQAPAVIISFLIGVPLGIEAAKRKGKATDSIINGINMVLIAVPALIIMASFFLLSVMGFGTSSMFSSGSIWSRFWPLVTLIFFLVPGLVVTTRRYVINEMSSDYIRFAYSQGFSTNKVFYIYVFRNAGILIIRSFPIALLGALYASAMVVERRWSIPGMSQVMVNASSGERDPYVILGYISFTAFIQIFSSLLGDLIIVWLDPRVSLGKQR